ncbi:MAG: toll/interleukin-1 receptor domain-containing protein [Hyphomicrobiales bacterium]|nr:toll/interleukin-1 receptor domain-containing protein [Hyphomicrobiales bacterium]
MRAFLSHSSADKPLATKIYRALRDQAVSVWFDRIELRPGDPLLAKISEGIGSSDCLLVLVTETSKQSRWVEKEVSIALTKEVEGTGPKVIPLLLAGCSMPTMLADKIYITIDPDGGGIPDIIPAVFRDSFILDIPLTKESLECDYPILRQDLYEFIRSDLANIRLRIENRNFNRRVSDIAIKTAQYPDIPRQVTCQIKDISADFDLTLPIYWVNLAELLSRAFSNLFSDYGKNLDAVNVAAQFAQRTMALAHSVMLSHIDGAVFSYYAGEFSHSDIAAYIRKYENSNLRFDEEELVRRVCDLRHEDDLIEVRLVGDETNKTIGQNLFARVSSKDRYLLKMYCDPSNIFSRYFWYCACLPQIIARSLFWSAFRDGKPLHELEYNVGLSFADYERVAPS